MRLRPVSRAIGERLGRDLPLPGAGQVPLLRQGAVITARFADRLHQHGIHAVWIEDAASEGIEPVELVPEELCADAAATVHDALTSARTAFSRNQPIDQDVMADLSGVVDALAETIVGSPDAALALVDLASADQYTHRHSVDVTALGLLLARTMFRTVGWTDNTGKVRFDRIEERLLKLGMGLLLHDIGKMTVPSEILNKPGPLDPDEWAVMRTHPDAGIALLPHEGMSTQVLSVVRDHHERWDGSGYPRGKFGADITQFARIAAIADVYDACSSARPYKDAMPTWKAVDIITSGSGTMFDPEVVDVFRRIVFPYPVGSEVEVEGRSAIVVENHPDAPLEPLLRFVDDEGTSEHRVDLSPAPPVPVG